jgi:hypothetical protein
MGAGAAPPDKFATHATDATQFPVSRYTRARVRRKAEIASQVSHPSQAAGVQFPDGMAHDSSSRPFHAFSFSVAVA